MNNQESTVKTASETDIDLFSIQNLPPIPELTEREKKVCATQSLGKSRADKEILDRVAEDVFQLWLDGGREPVLLDPRLDYACSTSDPDELRKMDECMAYDDDERSYPEGVNSWEDLDEWNPEHRAFITRFRTAQKAQARMIEEKCNDCPVRLTCLASSVTIQDERGNYVFDDSGQIYGGYGADARKKIVAAWTKKGSEHYYKVAASYQQMMDDAQNKEERRAARIYARNMGYVPEDLED